MSTAIPSIANRYLEISSASIREICQSQIDRLSEKLPVLDVWLVCWNQLENKRDMVSYRRNPKINTQLRSYLESECWITKSLPFLELTPLSLNSNESQAYVCGLGKTDIHWDYLLLWTEQQISRHQQDLVKDYARLLQQYLNLCQENLRQRAKNQLLEQALQQAEHQLRNPLSLIRLYAETIFLGAESDVQKHQASLIRRQADEISSNLSELLNCGRQACLRREAHSLLTLSKNVVMVLGPRLDKKQLTISQPNQSAFVMVDGWQFEQVLQNLLDNAIHFSPKGGKITVSWQECDQAVSITISDQGPGLNGIDRDQLFSPFFSKRPGGTGLGLAIAKKIVLDHGGRISAETGPQGGAKFSIFLPR
ncbi:MAG: HAMP domain-containing histidine kinase [Symploca sp. SIO2G7]|nr:HAMP domain-containing histidine kinase [Symploca sp. SIO2G7]